MLYELHKQKVIDIDVVLLNSISIRYTQEKGEQLLGRSLASQAVLSRKTCTSLREQGYNQKEIPENCGNIQKHCTVRETK
jgi:hypothetical protein